MELLLVLALLCALGLLAARWGVDSRESLRSKEEQLAALGLTWGPPAPSLLRMQGWHAGFELDLATARLAEDQRRAEMARLARQAAGNSHRIRGHLARVLAALATWLDPQTARTAVGGHPVGHPQSPS
jgi:hypothetical protein